MFLHGGLTHLAVNMFSLSQLGPAVSEVFTTKWFIWIYFTSGLMGSIFSISLQNQNLSIGASGAIFGLIGALLVWAIIKRKRQILKVLLINILINIGLGLSLPNIDNFAHLGGLVGGIVVAFGVLKLAKNNSANYV
jgi:rhomboid protease GluP